MNYGLILSEVMGEQIMDKTKRFTWHKIGGSFFNSIQAHVLITKINQKTT